MPDKLSSIRRHIKTGNYLMFPYASVRGSGALMSINPWRELPVEASALDIGALAVHMLDLSEPTTIHVSEYYSWLDDTVDGGTRDILDRYKIRSMPSSKIGTNFRTAEVRLGHRAKSWHVIRYEADPRHGGVTGVLPGIYVRIKDGPESLGRAIMCLLKDDSKAPTPAKTKKTGANETSEELRDRSNLNALGKANLAGD